MNQNFNIIYRKDSPILIVTNEPTQEIFNQGKVLNVNAARLLQQEWEQLGLPKGSVSFITPCPPIPETEQVSNSRKSKYVLRYRDSFVSTMKKLLKGKKLVIAFGATAMNQIFGKSTSIKTSRGTFIDFPGKEYGVSGIKLLPIYSPSHILSRPSERDIFNSDIQQIKKLVKNNWDFSVFAKQIDTAVYNWCLDLQFLIDNPPKFLCLDTETMGLAYSHGRPSILTCQLSYKSGESLIIPLNLDYYNDESLRDPSVEYEPLNTRKLAKIHRQLRELLGNPKVKVFGHNMKFDLHQLHNHGIEVANWYADTQQLAYAIDDNMLEKNLNSCIRRWVPEMAGYADKFDTETNKEKMREVPHAKMLRYAGGDTDACYRLLKVQLALAKKDKRNYNCFRLVQMRALRAFYRMEDKGMSIDKCALRSLQQELEVMEKEEYAELMSIVQKKYPRLLRIYVAQGKEINFNSSKFMIDLLFSKKGFNLKPIVFTKTTAKSDSKVPSTSIKEHLPYFDTVPFIQKYIAYRQLQQLRNTYVGKEEETLQEIILPLKNGKIRKKYETPLLVAKPDLYESPLSESTSREPIEEVSISSKKGNEKITLLEGRRIIVESKTLPTGFWKHITDKDSIHASFRLDNTVTGRSSCQDPNLQNIPKRGKLAKMFRRVFASRPGYTLIECDLSQAELRLVAWMANEKHMLHCYKNGIDLHARTAMLVNKLTQEQWDSLDPEIRSLQRYRAKAVNFGFIYGMWHTKFVKYAKTDYGVTYTEQEAKAIREQFFRSYAGLEPWHRRMKATVREYGYVRAMHGSLRRLPDIYSHDEMVQSMTERQSVNSPIQKFASDLGLLAMAELAEHADWETWYPESFVHDANYIEVKDEYADSVASHVKWVMQNLPLQDMFGITAPIPLISDVSTGKNLANMTERGDIKAVAPPWVSLKN